MKQIVSFVLAWAMLLTLTACSGGTGASGTDDSAVYSGIQTDWDVPAQSAALSDLFPDGVYVDVTNPDAAGVTVSHDIVYYEAGHDFTYGEGSGADEHTAEEAAEHTVITITEPGTYVLSGTLERGQIAVDLGDDAKDDPNAVVTLVLNGLDVTCTVAPAVIFYNVYECGSDDADTAVKDVDTSAAGANVVIPDGSINHVRGSYVARIYKSVELSEDGKEVIDSKKLHKYDGAFYSKMSLNISGGAYNSGVLNIEAENEGLDSELHLTINGGSININSGNDGLNTNEDGVSVTTVNGGKLDITVNGSTGEGDGIDSNGWLVINGGIVYAQACATSGDAGIDSDLGIYLNGGTVMASGNMLDRIAGGSATYGVFSFAESVKAGQNVYLKDGAGSVRLHHYADNSYRYLLLTCDNLPAGDYTLWIDDVQMAHSSTISGGMGFGGRMPDGMQPPEGFDPAGMGDRQPPEGFDPAKTEGMTPPEGMELPKDFDPAKMPRPDGGKNFADRGQGGEQHPLFTIAEGGNRFDGVSVYQTA